MAVHHPGLQMEIADLQAMIRRMVVQTFQNAAIGSAGMRVYDGGWITIENGGLNVSGQALISGLLDVTGRLEGSGTVDWTGPWFLKGTGEISGDVDLAGDMSVRGDVNVASGGNITAGPVVIDLGGPYGGRIRSTGNVLQLDALGSVVVEADYFVAKAGSFTSLSTMGQVTHSGIPVETNLANITHWVGMTSSGQLRRVPKSTGGPQGSGDFAWPFSLSTVTDEYGPRPLGDGFHNGIDFGVPEGTLIPAPADGTVLAKGYDAIDRGYWIALDHGDRGAGQLVTRYFHMQAASPLAVDASVAKGASIGLVGNTGFSTGPHLHWETWVNGTDINPRSFMAIYG